MARKASMRPSSYAPGAAKIWLDDDGHFLFGKYEDCAADDIAQDDPSYISWILGECNNIDEDDREILESIARYRGINY